MNELALDLKIHSDDTFRRAANAGKIDLGNVLYPTFITRGSQFVNQYLPQGLSDNQSNSFNPR